MLHPNFKESKKKRSEESSNKFDEELTLAICLDMSRLSPTSKKEF